MKRILLAFTFALLLTAGGTATHFAETVDFEAIAVGTIVDQVFGDGGTGPIGVSGFNPDLGLPGNAAVIFDSGNPPVTSTETIDDDLGTPNETFGGPGRGIGGELGSPFQNDTPKGHILIINEAAQFIDRDASGHIDTNDSPVTLTDDADWIGSAFTFDFSGVGPVTVHSIDIIDVEAEEPSALVELYNGGGGFIAAFGLPQTGDNGVATTSLGPTANVVTMVVTLNGSGAIDNLVFEGEQPFCGDGILDPGEECDDGNNIDGDGCDANCMVEEDGGEGCTPGYWKQEHHFDSWVGYSPGDNFNAIFGVSDEPSLTLVDAARRNGPPAKSLAKFGVAALLSASSPAVDFAYTEAEVIAIVQDGYATGEYGAAKNLLAAEVGNLTPCPLD